MTEITVRTMTDDEIQVLVEGAVSSAISHLAKTHTITPRPLWISEGDYAQRTGLKPATVQKQRREGKLRPGIDWREIGGTPMYRNPDVEKAHG